MVAGSPRLNGHDSQAAAVPPPRPAISLSSPGSADGRRREIHAAQIRLLYENAGTGAVAAILIASILAYAQTGIAPPRLVWGWYLFVLLVALGRFILAHGYWRTMPDDAASGWWARTFVAGTAMGAAGWGAAIVLFSSAGTELNETFVVFVTGGVMLGGASLLAARPEAFLTFLGPLGVLAAASLFSRGDEQHLMMGALVLLFTAVTITTTWRFHRAIASALALRFANHDLVESLSVAKQQAEALNRDLEARVRDRTARLTEADRRKDEFLATLAHELRNPLAAIRFAVENLRPASPPAAAARAREVVERQVQQLVRLVDDLLDVSRITADKMTLRCDAHDLAQLMTTAVESIGPMAGAADHRLTVRLPSRPLTVNGDGARLVQVFTNILNNSVKFTPRGGEIAFTAEEQDGEAVVRFRDSGIGIAPDALPRVFDLFHQADQVLDRFTGGLGIGLTLARRLVEMHAGRIELSSPGPGLGTEAVVWLPLTAQPAVAVVSPGPAAPAPRRTLRVLIVEDNVDAAEMLEWTVSHLGHTTRLAHDGGAAVAVAPEFAPDIVLLDIGLPVLNGYAVVQTLRAQPGFAHVHFAALTGWGQDEDRRKARDAGFDSHFTKPLDPEALTELLAAVAGSPTSQHEVTETPRTRLADSSRLR